MKKKLTILFLGVFLLMLQGIAQQRKITGIVSSTDGTPLSGVSVKVKGSSTGISTREDGTYTINAAQGQVLVYSYVGAATLEKTVEGSDIINVTLNIEAKSLSEVAVTAFGVRKNVRSLGFSTQNVNATEVVEAKQENLVNALQGKVAGVQITNSSGSPGASASIMIRGGNSLSGNNQPLFVVDGIPIDNSTPVGQGGLVASYGPATNRAIDINPDDIASITVLKGPAAAALYGIRAASGAIVITTKKGSGGSARITYKGTASADMVNKLPVLQSKYMQGLNGVADNSTFRSWGPQFGTGQTVYDNLKDFFQTSFAQTHDLSVSGSSERTNYYASGSFFDQGSITKNSEFKRESFRVNADTKAGDKLTIGTSASYIHTQREYVPQGSMNGVMGVYYWPRNDDMKNYLNPDGTQRRITPTGPDNPYWSIMNKPINDEIQRAIMMGNISYDPFEFLNISYRLGTDYYNDNFKAILMPTGTFGGSVYQTLSNNQITTSTLIATYKRDIGKDLHMSFSLGHNLETSKYNGTTSSASRFVDPSFPSINNTVGNDRSVSEYLNRRRIVAGFGDLTLNWKDIVYLNLRGRNDWSSTLPVANNSFFYPAISASAIFTDILTNMGWKSDNHIFSYGKIRAAYSEVGKDAPPHMLTTAMETITNNFTINPRGFITNVYQFGDPALKPEFTRSFEVGADLRFIDNRYGLDVTYFRSQSTNQILNTRVPPSSGAWFTYLNGGSIKNQGVELVVTTQPIIQKNFRWNLNVNFAANTSIVKDLPGLLTKVELSDTWTDNNGAEAAAFLGETLFGINGKTWKRDDNGTLLLTNGGYPQITDYTYVGDRNPEFTMGITNSFSLKNFSLDFMVDVRKGGLVYNATENSLVYSGLSTKTLDRSTIVLDGIIQSTGQKNTISIPLDQNFYQNYYTGESSNFVEDGGWTRLRYISLSYSFPSSKLGKIKNLALTLTGRNLILLTKYSGVDPEVSGSGAGIGGAGSFGFDNLGVPATKGFDFGVKLTF